MQPVVIGGVIIVPDVIRANLDGNGQISVQLPSTNDPDLSVTGWTYTVTEHMDNGRGPYQIEVPYTVTSLDLATIPIATPNPSAPSESILHLSDVGVIVAPQSFVTSVAASSGSSIVGFMQAGTGTVARTVQDRLRDVINVKDFGAIGNGTTDDTAAVQAAIAAISESQSRRGATLYFPRGQYKLTDTLTITSFATDNAINIALIGEGWLSTWLDFSSMTGTKDGIYVPNDQQVSIRGFFVKGSNSSGTRDGIRFGSTAGGSNAVSIFQIEDVRVQAWGRDGFSHYNSYMGTMTQCYAIANLRDGFRMDGFHTSLTFQNCYARSNTSAGFRINGMVYSQFLGCASDVNEYGFVGSNMRSTLFSGCGAEGNNKDGWLFFSDNAGAPTANPLFVQECYDVRGVRLANCAGYGNNVANSTFAGLVTVTATGIHSGAGTFNDGSPHRTHVTISDCDANVAVAGTEAVVTSVSAGGDCTVIEEGDCFFPGGRTIGASTTYMNRAMAGKIALTPLVAQTTTTAVQATATLNTTPTKNDLGATIAAGGITIPAGVNRVRVFANVGWTSNATGFRQLLVRKNAAGAPGLGQDERSANATDVTLVNVNSEFDVVAGDVISLTIQQTSGGNLDTLSGNSSWICVEAVH